MYRFHKVESLQASNRFDVGTNLGLCTPLTCRTSPSFEELEFQQQSYNGTYIRRDKHSKGIYTRRVDIHTEGTCIRRDIYTEVTYIWRNNQTKKHTYGIDTTRRGHTRGGDKNLKNNLKFKNYNIIIFWFFIYMEGKHTRRDRTYRRDLRAEGTYTWRRHEHGEDMHMEGTYGGDTHMKGTYTLHGGDTHMEGKYNWRVVIYPEKHTHGWTYIRRGMRLKEHTHGRT